MSEPNHNPAKEQALDEAGDSTVTAASQGTIVVSPEEKPSEKIGPYKLLQKLGEGGMGSVWMAERTEPIHQRVALKVIKPGLDSRQVLARFEVERQALALMDHPNIARVLDAGATPTGRPYFVMELVKGIPLTRFCDEQRLSIRERLELFVAVCQAVQHAHQKGVIHRDLKPGNVLVALYDGRPVPKVIDFGVAKATAQRLTERTLFTEFGAIIGTLEYMSPEQAELNQLDIDTRSDIYSLGVLLYELLTGSTPLAHETLRRGAFDEIRRRIREEEPPKPSTRLSQSKELLASLSAQRKLEPAQLTKVLRGDLDWVVMKALEKDRSRRYETANGLARDLQRHLENEPVLARPPSNLYRFQKLARRNKAAFAAVAAVTVALIAGFAISTWLFVKETAARRRADTEASKSQQVAKFLEEMLNGVGPAVALGQDTKMLRGILDRTAERVGKDLTNEPLVEAKLRGVIGQVYEALGDYSKAEAIEREALSLQRRLLGNERLEVAASVNSLARVLRLKNSLDEAETFQREALAIWRKLSGDQHPNVAVALDNLGTVLRDQGKFADAETAFRQALAIERRSLGNESLPVANTLNNLGNIVAELGRPQESETLLREALAIRKKQLTPEHPNVAESLKNLGATLTDEGKYAEAESLYRAALAIRRRVLDAEHPMVATSLDDVAGALRFQGKPAEAETLHREALAMRRKRLGSEHPRVAGSLINLANALNDQGKFTEAESLQREALAIQRKPPGKKHPEMAGTLVNLGSTLWNEGKLAEAEAAEREALELSRELLGNVHPSVAAALDNLAGILHDQGKLTEAEETVRSALAIQRTPSGNLDPNVTASLDRLTLLLLDRGKPAEAEAAQREALAIRRTQLPAEHPDLADSLITLAFCLSVQDKCGEAEAPAREGLAIFEKKLPEDWLAFNARSVLGDSLLRQNKNAEAEPLLLTGYEGMKQREEKIPFDRKPRFKEARERLAKLYETTGRPALAAELDSNLAPAAPLPR